MISEKIKLLEKDPIFKEIIEMIENGDFNKAKNTERDVFRIKLNDGRIINMHPLNTWENSSGDYDRHYIIGIDKDPLGYISRKTFENIGKKIKEFISNYNDF